MHNINLKHDNVQAKSQNQSDYLDAIVNNHITFGIGPAGTGKTFLAICKAVEAMTAGDVGRIVLTRPAVEAGEKLGFLPGGLEDKMEPFMAPLYDALNVEYQNNTIEIMLQKEELVIVPVAYMRGRTFMHSFIVVDEAQNLTEAQLKMVMTRFGEGSKMVINGDPTQCDLPSNVKSCLPMAMAMCEHGTEGVDMVKLDAMEDIQRHPVVRSVIQTLQELGF